MCVLLSMQSLAAIAQQYRSIPASPASAPLISDVAASGPILPDELFRDSCCWMALRTSEFLPTSELSFRSTEARLPRKQTWAQALSRTCLRPGCIHNKSAWCCDQCRHQPHFDVEDGTSSRRMEEGQSIIQCGTQRVPSALL